MSIFDIDYDKLVKRLFPSMLRRFKLFAWVKVLVSPVVWLYNAFIAFRLDVLYELDHNGQVCRLEGLLNDRFDDTLRRIYIEDAPAILPIFLYRRPELKPVYFRRRSEAMPKYGRRRSELTHGGAFIVKVPSAVVFDLAEMKALIDKYKLAGKAYTIIIF